MNIYSRHREMNLDLGILKMNVEYSVLPSSKRVGNETQKMVSSREGSVTQDIMKPIVQGEDYLGKTNHGWLYPKNLVLNKNGWVLMTA